MQYRRLGRTELSVSAISLGTEYLIGLPRDHIVGVVEEAVGRGVNYFDLFCAQPEFRDSMGTVFSGCRNRVLLAAHLGAIEVDGQYSKTRDPEVSKRYFEDFLRRYRTEYADVLFLHNIDSQDDYDRVFGPRGLLDLARQYQREGKARFLGFGGHTVATALQAVQSGEVDVLMYPINLTGNAEPGKRELLAACVRNDTAVVAMKPFAGGRLLSGSMRIAMETAGLEQEGRVVERPVSLTPVQCLSYVLGQVGVSTVVPGCKDREELRECLAYCEATDEERDFSGALAEFEEYERGKCVYCNHCLPCPAGINIGQTIRLVELAGLGLTESVKAAYQSMSVPASECVQCGLCEDRCPFGVDTTTWMEKAVAAFE